MPQHRTVGDYGELFTIAAWRDAVKVGAFNEHDGSGAFVKDGKYMTEKIFDDVFGPAPEGATHVEWYNK